MPASMSAFCSVEYGIHCCVLGSWCAQVVTGPMNGSETVLPPSHSPLTSRVFSVLVLTCIMPDSDEDILPLRASLPQRSSNGEFPKASLPPDGWLRMA